ncbi:MAG TPA: hypothetical protein DCM71_19055 [Runella sp.]|nr:hypothetical protein [Runella sp.]
MLALSVLIRWREAVPRAVYLQASSLIVEILQKTARSLRIRITSKMLALSLSIMFAVSIGRIIDFIF